MDTVEKNAKEVEEFIDSKTSRFGSELEDTYDDYESKNQVSEYDDIFENVLNTSINCNKSGLQVESIINSLVSGYFLIPGFQRRFVWKKNQIAFLALSIIKDIPIPPLYLYIDKLTKKQVVLDGQQRVTAVFLYFMGLYFVSEENRKRFDFNDVYQIKTKVDGIDKEILKLNQQLNIVSDNTIGQLKKEIKKYQMERKSYMVELRDKYKLEECEYAIYDKNKNKIDISINQFDESSRDFLYRKTFELAVVQCMDDRPQKIYANIFKLLNSGGKMLGTQEIRNGIYWESVLYQKLFDINENNQTWRNIYGKLSVFSKDIEILLKVLSLNYYTKLDGTKLIIHYEGTFNWVNIMESFSEACLSLDEKQVEKHANMLNLYLKKIDMKDSKRKCKKAIFEAVFVAFCKLELLRDDERIIDYSWMCSLEEEAAFEKVLSNKSSVEGRLTRAYEIVEERYSE